MGAENISIEILSATLKRHKHKTCLVFDRALFNDKQYFPVKPLSKIFNQDKKMIKEIIAIDPDIVAFSVFTDIFQWTLRIASCIKKSINPHIIFGGIHPTCVPDLVISYPQVDSLCIGEGDDSLVELADSIDNGEIDYSIKNLWFRKDGQIIKNPPRPLIEDLDTTPMPDKELFEPYWDIKDYYLTVTNKGCISKCTFCSQGFLYGWEKENKLGKFIREKSVDYVLEEFKWARKKYNIRYIDIKNNILSASRRWTEDFLARFPGEIGIPFRIMGHPILLNEEYCKGLKEAGCHHVQVGVETIDPKIRSDILDRRETNEQILEAINNLEKVGINYSLDFIFGLPGQNSEDITRELKIIAPLRHMVRASIFWLEYFPAYPITGYAHDRRLIDDNQLQRINTGYQENYMSTGSVEDNEQKKLLKNAMLCFRLAPVTPAFIMNRIISYKLYRIFRYMPQTVVIGVVDVIVSWLRRDYWANYAMKSYLMEIINRITKDYFRKKNTCCGR
ncbi:MAG: radical SAM protein [Planctomycetes bacterium]|nr:radical SAM protein [Planctomycetota bacterium]